MQGRAAILAFFALACAAEHPRGVGQGHADVGSEDPADDEGDASSSDGETIACDAVELAAVSVLQGRCGQCHVPGDDAVTGFDYLPDTARLVTEGKLVPGAAELSSLYLAVEGGQMPPATEDPVSESELAQLRLWIDECLHDEPCASDGPIGIDGMLERMSADLLGAASIDATDRPFIRYFTLTHLYDAGLCGAELDPWRRAISKAMNSLSTAPQIVIPTPVDADATIYRIDLRDYGWDSADWDALVAANAWSIEYTREEAVDLQTFTETPVPMIRGDWFAAVAIAPPLYHDLLDLPVTRTELETQLGIDVDADILADRVVRAGFLESAISENQRLIQRHDVPGANNRAYWVSYDFASSEGTADLFAHPLDFTPDGRLHLFTLPNGLQAYMITNVVGIRVDHVDPDIMVDPKEADLRAVNGRSCMRCHMGGVSLHADELRAYVENSFDFDAETKEKVARLHPPAANMQAIQALDAERHDAALVRAGVPPLADEPIGVVDARYRDDVDLAIVAAELGMAKEELVLRLGGLSPALQALASETISRGTFTQEFAAAVCELNLGASAACPVDPTGE